MNCALETLETGPVMPSLRKRAKRWPTRFKSRRFRGAQRGTQTSWRGMRVSRQAARAPQHGTRAAEPEASNTGRMRRNSGRSDPPHAPVAEQNGIARISHGPPRKPRVARQMWQGSNAVHVSFYSRGSRCTRLLARICRLCYICRAGIDPRHSTKETKP